MAADVGRWSEELGQLSTVFAAAPLKVRHRCLPHSVHGSISAASDYMHCSHMVITLQQVLFYTHWMAQLTSASAVALVYLFFVISVILQRCACLATVLVAVPHTACTLTHTAALAQGAAGTSRSRSVSAGAPGGRPEERACTSASSSLVSRTQQWLGRRARGTAGPRELGPTRKADLPLEAVWCVTACSDVLYLEAFPARLVQSMPQALRG
jgi:hypothetical protein